MATDQATTGHVVSACMPRHETASDGVYSRGMVVRESGTEKRQVHGGCFLWLVFISMKVSRQQDSKPWLSPRQLCGGVRLLQIATDMCSRRLLLNRSGNNAWLGACCSGMPQT
eukprot:2153947-Amphidinium_carterae.2